MSPAPKLGFGAGCRPSDAKGYQCRMTTSRSFQPGRLPDAILDVLQVLARELERDLGAWRCYAVHHPEEPEELADWIKELEYLSLEAEGLSWRAEDVSALPQPDPTLVTEFLAFCAALAGLQERGSACSC